MGDDFVQEKKLLWTITREKQNRKQKEGLLLVDVKYFKYVIFILALASYNTKEHIKGSYPFKISRAHSFFNWLSERENILNFRFVLISWKEVDNDEKRNLCMLWLSWS